MKRLTALIAAISAAFVLAACGGEDEQPKSTGGSSPTATTQAAHNDADVQFAQDMIMHHRQAIEMAELALAQAESQEVKALATEIKAAQDPEIQQMSSWLTAWGEDVPEDTAGGHESMGHTMPGMMTEDQMNQLKAARGREFDTMFLTMMIEHHQGAIEMAKAVQTAGENPDVKTLAKSIESAQTAEITRMNDLLDAISP